MMSRLFIKSTLVISLVTVMSFPVFGNGGRIQFRGQITDPPCDLKVRPTSIDIHCIQQHIHHRDTLSIDEVRKGKMTHGLLADVAFNYLNTKRTLANLELTYK